MPPTLSKATLQHADGGAEAGSSCLRRPPKPLTCPHPALTLASCKLLLGVAQHREMLRRGASCTKLRRPAP